jgi:hypothetical protein
VSIGSNGIICVASLRISLQARRYLHDSGLPGFLKCIICNSTKTFLLKNKLRNYIDEKMGYGYKL